MKTIKIDKNGPAIGEILAMAQNDSLLLLSEDGRTFVLEEADEFDREVESLGANEGFMQFLEGRSKEGSTLSIEQIAQGLAPSDI